MVGQWLVVLSLVTSLLMLLGTAAEPRLKDFCDGSHQYDCQEENAWIDGLSNKNRGAAESLLDNLNSVLRNAELELANPNDYPPHYNVKDGEEFDFIVVGAGSAGSVVASRLSEVGEWRVLLVEAGGDPPKTSEFPALAYSLLDTEVDWQYKTDPDEESCLGMVGNRCSWTRGKVLGGSSTTNFMMFTRGHPRDFDGWAKASNKGWSYEEVLPYFKKSEDLNHPLVWANDDAGKYHNKGGLLSISSWPENEVKKAIDIIADGFEESGYPYNVDVNGKNQSGFTKMQGSLRDHRRCSTAKAFLMPAKNRGNLFLSKHSLVTKVLVDAQNSHAYGIQLTNREGSLITVRAKKEIVVSAGAINSPQLLMLSGIGPKRHLQDLGIPVLKDLPVGENLQDHSLMLTTALTIDMSISFPPPNIDDTLDFLLKRPSKLSCLHSFPYAAFISTVSDDYPDIELLQQHVSKNDKDSMTFVLKTFFKIKDEMVEDYIKINEEGYTIVMLVSMMRPYSRGRISLRSTDPNTHPKIVAGTFSDRRDINTYLRTYDFLIRLVNTKSMKRAGVKFHEVKVPGCSNHVFGSSEYRECAMRHLTATTYHYSGTCKMGPAGDTTAVVDPSLRVHGVGGLRVVDASVMPTIVSGHINAAVIMMAEKAADMIKEYWASL